MKDPEIQRGHMLQKATLLRYTIVWENLRSPHNK
jgi:hypothetical protein